MIVVFDVGGTHTRVGVSRDGKKIFAMRVAKTPKNFSALIQLLVKMAHEMRDGGAPITKIVGGVPGVLNRAHTMLARAPHAPAFERKNFVVALRRAFRAPVILENDTALVGLGEARAAGLTKNVTAYIGVGTGVGGVRIVAGHVDVASFGFEPGHQIIDRTTLATEEDLISGAAIRARFKKSPHEIADPRVWDETARDLAIALHNTILHWSPDHIILGGSMITKRPGISVARVRAHLKKIKIVFRALPKITVARLGDFGGLHGALIYASQRPHASHRLRT